MRQTILAIGGHGFGSVPADRAVCELLLRLAAERAGGRPRIGFLAVPGEEASRRTAAFYACFAERACEPADLSLPRLARRPGALREQLLAQDLVYLWGASQAEILALCGVCELGDLLSAAWRSGIVLAGQGAGATCWFQAGIGADGRAGAGLGLVAGSLCVGYGEADRRAAYLDAIAGGMPGGFGLADHAALLWEGDGEPAALTARRGSRAYRVCGTSAGVAERPVPARLLPAPAPSALREDIAEYRRIAAMRRRAGWLG